MMMHPKKHSRQLTAVALILAGSLLADPSTAPQYYRVEAEHGVFLRATPDQTASALTVIPFNEFVHRIDANPIPATIDSHNGHWIKISYKHFEGWSFDYYLRSMDYFFYEDTSSIDKGLIYSAGINCTGSTYSEYSDTIRFLDSQHVILESSGVDSTLMRVFPCPQCQAVREGIGITGTCKLHFYGTYMEDETTLHIDLTRLLSETDSNICANPHVQGAPRQIRLQLTLLKGYCLQASNDHRFSALFSNSRELYGVFTAISPRH